MINLNKFYVNNKEIYKYDHIKWAFLNKLLDHLLVDRDLGCLILG